MGVYPVSNVVKDSVDGGWGLRIWVAIVQSLGRSWLVFGLDLVGLCVSQWLAVAIFFGVILVVTEERG